MSNQLTLGFADSVIVGNYSAYDKHLETFEAMPFFEDYDPDTLCVVFTASERGKAPKPHFCMHIDDAMKWCSDKRTKGAMHGSHWMYCWTTWKNFTRDVDDIKPIKWYDNGKWDWLMEELGLRKLEPPEGANIRKI